METAEAASGLQFGAGVFAFQFAYAFLERFQFHGETVEDLVGIVLRAFVGEVGDGWMDLHEEPCDVAAGFADLGDGGGAVHGGGT